jgi:4-amino-4-deoxy-L-arabinose transferase-like glycosyltransferase
MRKYLCIQLYMHSLRRIGLASMNSLIITRGSDNIDMKQSIAKDFLWMFCIGFSVFFIAERVGSISHAVEIGSDEHFELTKGLLWAKGYPLYSRIWDDQPPFHTVLLGVLFKLFGPSVVLARGLALSFGILLFSGCFVAVRKQSGFFAASIAVVTLLSSPEVLRLSISVMLEVPAIAIGLLALWPIYRFGKSSRRRWLVISGVILAVALQTKLTAAIFIPAMTVQILLVPRRGGTNFWLRQAPIDYAAWVGTASALYVLIGLTLGSGYDQAWESHFSWKTRQAAELQGPAFSVLLLFKHPEGMWGAIAGLLVAVVRREWRQIAFPAVLLGTTFTIHCNHRPYWDYYYLHFALPLAWLTGYGIANLLRFALRYRIVEIFRPPFVRLAAYLVASLLISAQITYGTSRLVSEVVGIQGLPWIDDDPLIARMKEYARQTKWVYAEDSIYAFHAGLPVIPELAVRPAKRFWSGQINDAQIGAIVQRYKPEEILLADARPPPALEQFIGSNYVLVCHEDACSLYIAKLLVR